MYLAGWFGEADKISIFLKEGESGICKREAEISKIGMSWRLSNVLKGKDIGTTNTLMSLMKDSESQLTVPMKSKVMD